MKKYILPIAILLGVATLSNAQSTIPKFKPSKEAIKEKNKTAKQESRSRSLNPDQSVFLEYSTQYDTAYRESYKYLPGTSLEEEILKEYFISSGNYQKSQKTVRTYTSSQLLATETNWYWDGTNWEQTSKIQIDYDQYGNEIQFTYSFWDGNSWMFGGGFKSTNTYNTAGKILTSIYSYYNGTSWEEDTKMTNTYNSSNHQTSVTYEMYDNGNWIPSDKEEYTLNASGHWTEVMGYYWNPIDNIWIEDSKIINITWLDFDEFLPLEGIFQVKDGGNWVNDEKYIATYNANKQTLTETFQRWIFQSWVNYKRSSNTYDSQGNLTESLEQMFAGNWVTTDGERFTHTYDANNNILSIEYLYYDINQWKNSMKRINYYLSSSSIPVLEERSLNIYPNPAKEFIIIDFGIEKTSSIKVFNITGQQVISLNPVKNSKKEVVDLSALENGVYFLQITSEGQTSTRKFIKN